MNFPGLDPAWTLTHHATHYLGLTRTWPLLEARTVLAHDEKVLVVASTALGDSILTTPLIETLFQRLGPGRVSLLVKAPYADLYKNDPRLHRLFTVRGKYRWSYLRRDLRNDPHRIALLANLTEPDLIPWLWWCGVRGFLRYRTRWTSYPRWIANEDMLRRPGDDGYATGHAIDNNLAMAEALRLEPVSRHLSLPHLNAEVGTHERRILIHPGASREFKRWPVENWARLADTLAAQFDCAIGLTGDRSELALAAIIAARMKSPSQVLAGKLTLSELGRTQGRAVAFLSGDTGPYHLALAVGCPTLTLFAPLDRGSSTESCGPHQANPVLHRTLQTVNMGDSISSISFEQVLAAASEVVAASLARSVKI